MQRLYPLLLGLAALSCGSHESSQAPAPRTARQLAFSYAQAHGTVPTAGGLLAASLSQPEVRARLQSLLSPADWSALQDTAAALANAPLRRPPPLEELGSLSRLADSADSNAPHTRPLGLRAIWALLGEPPSPGPDRRASDLDAADRLHADLARVLDTTPPDSLALVPNVRVLTLSGDSARAHLALVGADWSTVRMALRPFHLSRSRLLE